MAPHKGFKHSAETIEKIRASSTGRLHTPETRAKLSVLLKGKRLGTKFSDERKARHNRAMQTLCGVKRPDEVRAKISASLIGHTVTNASRQKMSISARPNAQFKFEGGQAGMMFAEVLCPAGYIREHYLYYGTPVTPFFRGILRRHFFRLDFAHPEAMINIEIDGPPHLQPKIVDKDAARDKIIREIGWRVIRIKL